MRAIETERIYRKMEARRREAIQMRKKLIEKEKDSANEVPGNLKFNLA
jgi:hypothetical protein